MTHFTVLVIGDNPEDQLAPFHEFESTGRDDQYVSNVDFTAVARVEYMADTRTMLVVPPGAVSTTSLKYELFKHPVHGTLISLFEDCFKVQPANRDPLTGDKYVVPEGYLQLTVPCNEIMPFSKWEEYYYGYPTVSHNSLFTKPYPEDLKYGYVLLDAEGEVSAVIKRTNAAAQWDWFELGGRWAGKFKLRAGCSGVTGSKGSGMESIRTGWVSAARLGDIDLEGMVFEERAKASKQFDDYWAVVSKYPKAYGRQECQKALSVNIKESSGSALPIDPQNPLSELRSQVAVNKFYGEQPAIKALQETLGSNWDCYIDTFGHDRDAYIHERCSAVMSTFALLHKGEWTARDTYWGAGSAEQVPQLEWNKVINNLLVTLPADTWVSVYDCHI